MNQKNKTSIPQPIGPEEIVYQGKIIEVVRQPMKIGGKELFFEYARRSPGTRLIITSPDNKLLLTKEYRFELEDWDFRLPGGKVFNKLADYNKFLASDHDILEKAKKAATNEAIEEVGIIIDAIKHYSTSKCGATVIWDLFYFVVTEYTECPDGQRLEAGENIELIWLDPPQVKEICLNGKMREERSVAVLLRYLFSNLKVI